MRVAGVISTQVSRKANEKMRKEYNIPSHVPNEEMSEWIGKEMARRVLEDVSLNNQ